MLWWPWPSHSPTATFHSLGWCGSGTFDVDRSLCGMLCVLVVCMRMASFRLLSHCAQMVAGLTVCGTDEPSPSQWRKWVFLAWHFWTSKYYSLPWANEHREWERAVCTEGSLCAGRYFKYIYIYRCPCATKNGTTTNRSTAVRINWSVQSIVRLPGQEGERIRTRTMGSTAFAQRLYDVDRSVVCFGYAHTFSARFGCARARLHACIVPYIHDVW